MLALHPEAFTSDAESDARKEPADYLHRLGLERRDGGQFLLGAWRGERLSARSAASATSGSRCATSATSSA